MPAAIHVSPEAAAGGPLAKVMDGDVLRVDALSGELHVLVPDIAWAARPVSVMPGELRQRNGVGMGRGLFANMRARALTAEEGAMSWM